MTHGDWPSLLALLFIFAMAWLRARLRYPRAAGSRLRLSSAGFGYFAALLALLAGGWFAAPTVAAQLGLAPLLSATFARAAWFLAAYLLFIPVHRALMARDVQVFRVVGRPD